MNRYLIILSLTLILSQVALSEPPTTQSSNGELAVRHLQLSGQDSTRVGAALRFIDDFKSYSDFAEVDRDLAPGGMPGEGGTFIKTTVNYDTDQATITIGPASYEKAKLTNDQAADLIVGIARERFADTNGLEQAKLDDARVVETTARIDELQRRLEDERTALRKQTGATDVSPASIRQSMDAMQMQEEQVKIDLAAKQARSDALAEQIARFSSQIQEKIKADPIAAELQKVVEYQQKQLDLAQQQQKSGTAPQREVDQVASHLAEAKAKLLERQEAAANAAGGDVVSNWNRELMTISIDLAELRARSKALDQQLAAYANADDYLNNADQWLAQISDLQKQAAALKEKANSEQAEYYRNHVQITVIKDSSNATTQATK